MDAELVRRPARACARRLVEAPSNIADKVSGGTWLYPLYTWLAIGSSHSVHMLLTTNLELAGSSSLNDRALLGSPGAEEQDDDEKWECFMTRLGSPADPQPVRYV